MDNINLMCLKSILERVWKVSYGNNLKVCQKVHEKCQNGLEVVRNLD